MNMATNLYRSLIASAVLGLSGAAMAAVSVDDNGNGFVGKGDVQSLFDWNNAQLQENADRVKFRYGNSSSVAWTCEGVNPTGHVVTTHMEATTGVSSSVAFDARKNKNGQITGFILNGMQEASTAYMAAGTCNGPLRNWQVQPALVGDVSWDGLGEPTLQVSIDGEVWLDLSITY